MYQSNRKHNVTLAYSYDGTLPTQETFSGTVSGSLTRSFDTNFRVTGLALNGSNVALGYDRDSLLTSAVAMTLAVTLRDISDSAPQPFSSAFDAGNVVKIAAAGRARWKKENENNNTLKTKGYHFEHSFGHSKVHLANLLATMILLAFLLHTALDWFDERYHTVRERLPSGVPSSSISALSCTTCLSKTGII